MDKPGEFTKSAEFEVLIDNDEDLSLLVFCVSYEAEADTLTLHISFNVTDTVDVFERLRRFRCSKDKRHISISIVTPQGEKLHTITDQKYELKNIFCELSYDDSTRLLVHTKWES